MIGTSYTLCKKIQDIYDSKSMGRHYFPVSFVLCLCHLIKFAACLDDPASLNVDASINCGGSSGVSASHNGREWLGDAHPRFASSLRVKGKSTISSVARDSVSADSVPYKTARVSRSGFSYVFLVNPGEKFIRLHFNPTPYKGFQKYKDLFTVEAGPFTLLSNFSASLTADALGLSSVIKEFCISVEENQPLDIVFTPTSSLSGDTFAFVNGIEIITVPLGRSYFHHDGDIGAQVVGRTSQQFYVDNSTVIETVRRVNIKRDGDDIDDMFGMWATFPKEKANQINNITWKISVDVGFRYLVRLHFSKLGLKLVQETDSVNFKVLINKVIAYNNIEFVRERDIIMYNDYMVMIKGRKEGTKHDILVSLQSYNELMDGYSPFTGFEILKLSNLDNSLACPNPLPIAQRSPSSTVQTLLLVLGRRNAIITISIAIIALANIIAHKLREIREASYTMEENKPPARAECFCRLFSLAEIQSATRNFSDHLIIGKGGFGKVYKGLIDNGKETVAIKRLKSNSRQGAHEFLTEIETLSKLRHINLVSLIGYCDEQREMILVYEYMACGTLGDHLYKLSRKGYSCACLTWKQRLKISIGAARGLDYLHTGNGVIHRDVKVSNILLDEKFTAKVSDFGLVKHENLSNLQSYVSTNVKGTFGYLDPTYLRTGKLTRKSDTYAFGVVLLEVLCGRPALDQSVSVAEQILTKWAREKISEGKVELIVASNLKNKISPNSLRAFIEVVGKCLDDEPKKRPTMAQVVLQLEFALEQQDIKEPVLNEMTVHAPCIDETNSFVCEQATMTPSVSECTPISPPKEETNDKIDNVDPPYRRKEGRKATSNKPSRIWPWEALWNKVKQSRKNDYSLSEICEGINLPKFDWAMIAFATNRFSSSNKIGDGPQGPVYKALFPSGQMVAVRRFSASNNKSLAREFIDEILIVQKLQHRNILKLLGYCIHKENAMFVHEFMENAGLDRLIFGKFQHLLWTQRLKIIVGIARGVAYLHQDSGMRIVHRDLKLRHILLDIHMNPKIKGFGIAKTLEEGSYESISTAVCGTPGYLCPEYYLEGKVSVKSDVYSFGVMVLEIVSGRTCIRAGQHVVSIARELWKEDKALDLVDLPIGGNVLTPVEEEEVLRCIKVGLICTQSRRHSRPTMTSVIRLLEGELSSELDRMLTQIAE